MRLKECDCCGSILGSDEYSHNCPICNSSTVCPNCGVICEECGELICDCCVNERNGKKLCLMCYYGTDDSSTAWNIHHRFKWNEAHGKTDSVLVNNELNRITNTNMTINERIAYYYDDPNDNKIINADKIAIDLNILLSNAVSSEINQKIYKLFEHSDINNIKYLLSRVI